MTSELLFNHKEYELLAGHLLHGLCIRLVELTAYPVILGVASIPSLIDL